MRSIFVSAGFAALLSGCSLGDALNIEPRTDAAYGRQLFEQNCVACHGRSADGQGTALLELGIDPPDLTQLSRRNDGDFPRDRVMSAIDGFGRQNHWENPMPIFGDDGLGPTIQIEKDGLSTPIPSDLLALANYLESIQD